MFTVRDVQQPETLDEAYKILSGGRNNTVLGGCAFLKMGRKRISVAVDLSGLSLDYIREADDSIEIGAMTTLRELETHPICQENFNGILAQAVRNIIGVQFRNGVTVGGSVFARYGFSDLIPALLVLESEVELYKAGLIPLREFLQGPYVKDILVCLRIPKSRRAAAYCSFRKSASDFAVLNAAVSKSGDSWLIAVGARPGRATLALNSAELLRQGDLSERKLDEAAQKAAAELTFGTNARGTASYRQALCRVLVKKGIREVLKCASN